MEGASSSGKRSPAIALADPASGARLHRRQLVHRVGGQPRAGFIMNPSLVAVLSAAASAAAIAAELRGKGKRAASSVA